MAYTDLNLCPIDSIFLICSPASCGLFARPSTLLPTLLSLQPSICASIQAFYLPAFLQVKVILLFALLFFPYFLVQIPKFSYLNKISSVRLILITNLIGLSDA